MKDLLQLLRQYPALERVEQKLEAGGPCFAEGLWGSAAAMLVAALAERAGRTLLCVLPHIEQAEEFLEDIALFSPGLPAFFPAWETTEEDELPDADALSQRLAVLKGLSIVGPNSRAGPSPQVIVAPVQAVVQQTPSPLTLRQSTILIRRGLSMPPEKIVPWLLDRRFQSVRRVEVPGEFCRRGGILDIFPYAAEFPVRVEYFGDEIESLRTFDPATQAGLEETRALQITAVPRRAALLPAGHRAWSLLLDHLPADAWLVLKDPAEIMERSGALPARVITQFRASTKDRPKARPPGPTVLRRAAGHFTTLNIAALPGVFSGSPVTFHVHSVERFGHELSATLQELELVTSERRRTVVFCNNAGEKQRLTELLAASGVIENPRFDIRIGRLNHGFDWTDLSLALLTHHELFRRYRQRRMAPRYRHTRAVEGFYELDPGDLVVHAVHGIGIYRGMELLQRGTDKQECLRIEYAERSFLFVPASRIELVQKYVGPSERRPPLNRLGTKTWQKRKARTEEAVRDFATELLRLQAVREAEQGIHHLADADWQREFEAAFPYEETEGQLKTADRIRCDMERLRPMDRLICGDVGYGKTELAMRAAFKAVMGGYQVALLVPTTVLAAQHTRTFSERMADYPLRVEMLSRFLTPSQQASVLEGLAVGQVDIVIGTHRLIQADIAFKNLGLVIVDEEQRFGVEHKERLKQLRATVDVLTLTATPIPRTLHMSLMGIRDISSLETPPRDRLAIRTRLMRYDPHKIKQAVLHEMARDGQVFFVHNRVETIDSTAGRLRELVPQARILVAHGQMPERRLAQTMTTFVEHGADLLVCTTIIESGLDIPNVNTIIIDRADMFGLAELHQLRGRVGRYKHRAYAYMLLPADRPVTPVAEKRLKAIEEFCELGAGFRIAMRDLEIRGAGNILGPEQSGHLSAVGYDMYCRLLERAVRSLKNEPVPEEISVSLSLGLEAFLPRHYVPDPPQRIDFYRKLQRATDLADIQTLRAQLRDRFGEIPREAENLLTEGRVRLLSAQAGICAIALRDSALLVTVRDRDRAAAVLAAADQPCRQVDDETFVIRLPKTRISSDFVLSFLTNMLEKGLSARHCPESS